MIREIKFRGYNLEREKWMFGTGINETEFHEGELLKSDFHLWTKEGWYQVEKESISQFTGLHDKNGVPIYEGDIFQIIYHENIYDENFGHDTKERIAKEKVIFKNGEFRLGIFNLHEVLSSGQELSLKWNVYEKKYCK